MRGVKGTRGPKPAIWRRIGARVRALREVRGIPIDDLANRIGTQKGALSLMEHGQRDFGTERLRRIAKEFNVTVDELYGAQQQGVA